MDENYKEVSLPPIIVPIGDYCWNPHNYAICIYFENHGGNLSCDLCLGYNLKYAEDGGVLKPEKCKRLT